ncbi:MAG: tRNA threonylcarbamoyladenosine dehydratase [Oscillibacter sp.]|nr:tRNA threonylcarbamoyladenosine dehydratase [Oscillibacter sp.]MBQ9617125.1 tRNA threonylcarbamoyladenosine dehydratase [Oscillibacter sp.]
MTEGRFSRTELLFGSGGMEKLSRARVAVFGLGGVGGYAAEALTRSGIGALDFVDHDLVSESNLNRQILATSDTVGRYKADVARERALSINPDATVHAHRVFYTPETAAQFDFSRYDYIVDAIDTVTGKLTIAEEAYRTGTPLVSSMGTGNKLRPSMLEVSDIYETSVCPLARVMRKELRRRGIPRLKVVWSREPPLESSADAPARASGRPVPGSTAFVPAAAGLLLASEVVRDLLSRP